MKRLIDLHTVEKDLHFVRRATTHVEVRRDIVRCRAGNPIDGPIDVVGKVRYGPDVLPAEKLPLFGLRAEHAEVTGGDDDLINGDGQGDGNGDGHGGGRRLRRVALPRCFVVNDDQRIPRTRDRVEPVLTEQLVENRARLGRPWLLANRELRLNDFAAVDEMQTAALEVVERIDQRPPGVSRRGRGRGHEQRQQRQGRFHRSCLRSINSVFPDTW